MKPLWKIVQIVRYTWVLVAKDKSNHPAASLRGVPQESWATLSGKANDWRNREHVCVCAVLRMSKWWNLKLVSVNVHHDSLQGSQVSMQCSECQSGEKFKQTRVKGGSVYDSLKVTSSECPSDGHLTQAWLTVVVAMTLSKQPVLWIFKVMEIQTRVAFAELWLRDDVENIYALLFRFLGFGFCLAMSNVGPWE